MAETAEFRTDGVARYATGFTGTSYYPISPMFDDLPDLVVLRPQCHHSREVLYFLMHLRAIVRVVASPKRPSLYQVDLRNGKHCWVERPFYQAFYMHSINQLGLSLGASNGASYVFNLLCAPYPPGKIFHEALPKITDDR